MAFANGQVLCVYMYIHVRYCKVSRPGGILLYFTSNAQFFQVLDDNGLPLASKLTTAQLEKLTWPLS
jgi:hypothetical protein